MSVLGLCCCTWAFSSSGKLGLLCVEVNGLLTAVASLVVGTLWHSGLVAPWHMESSQRRDRTHVPCIGRQIPNHGTTREVLILHA